MSRISEYVVNSAFFFLLCLPVSGQAMNVNDTLVKLACADRENVEVNFHLYGNVSELWGDKQQYFYIGRRLPSAKNRQIFRFTNGDLLIHYDENNRYQFRYTGQKKQTICAVLKERRNGLLALKRVPSK
jgi:hypothetical protein